MILKGSYILLTHKLLIKSVSASLLLELLKENFFWRIAIFFFWFFVTQNSAILLKSIFIVLRSPYTGRNAASSLHHNTGFEVGTTDARSCKPDRPFSDGPRRCIHRTIRDCRGCRSSRAVYRLDRSGSSGFSGSSRLNHAGMTFLKLLHLSDNLCLSFCPRHLRCRPKSLCCRLF